MTWFESLTGVTELDPDQVRSNFTLDGTNLISRVNGKNLTCGWLETPSLKELRERVRLSGINSGRLTVQELVANVQDLHTQRINAGSVFQVASQFNLLEMTSPNFTPEHGIGIYERDPTQGPACAIACGAGTIFRNYFTDLSGHFGQTETHQIDCLEDIGTALGNSQNELWEMRNGYALVTENGLKKISSRLRSASEDDRDILRQKLRIGLQWDTQVTLGSSEHLVSQIFCSALPVSYCDVPSHLWADFAQFVLESTYEATICAAALNSLRTGNPKVFLTLVGGGAFGNRIDWIIDGIERVLDLYRNLPLEIAIVSYGRTNQSIQLLVNQYNNRYERKKLL